MGLTYNWFSMVDLRGVAVGISSRLQSFVVTVTMVDEHIMQVRMKHTLGFIPIVAVYAPIKMSEAAKKDVFYKLNSLLSPTGHTNCFG